MSFPIPLVLAEYHRPLFGNTWLALLAILGGVAVLMAVVRQVGIWLAATHPALPTLPVSTIVSAADQGPDATTLAIIAASIATVLGARVRIKSIQTTPQGEPPSQQWSVEGRRQIYSSHQIR